MYVRVCPLNDAYLSYYSAYMQFCQVLFLNNINQDLKNALVSKSNIFVMPSVINKKSVEGFGIAFVEAAQYGVPSIGGKDLSLIHI